MKNRNYILTLLALLVWGCQDFDTYAPSGNEAGLMVNLDIPEPVVVKTRAGMKDDLLSLSVLVFDKNGLYLSKHEGKFVSGTTTNANYKFESIPTTREGEIIILHFVANYDFKAFIDAENVGKSEAEVMNRLTVTNGNVAYWQRVELPNGLNGAKGTTITLKDDVSLLRNIAKITVENLTNEPVGNKYLTDVTFAIGNYIDRGTVAPYSTTLYKFVKGAITEAVDGNIVSIADESEFVSAQNGSASTPSDFKYIYERKNSTTRNQTYIIIKAYFQNNSLGTNTTSPSYYKIDIDDDKGTKLLDIERNSHYIIRINDVATEGHLTLEEAMNNPASNNINAAVQVAEYTSVSDGTNILQIEKAVFSFVTSGQDFKINYSYFDGITSQTDNSKITVSFEQDKSMKVIRDGSFSYSNGIISATTADIPTNNDIYQATFIITDGKYLSRKITIRLRKPVNFQNVSVVPNNGTDPTYCIVANTIGQPVRITFSFPPDISPAIFPLPVYIYSNKLSPDPTKEGIQPLSIDPKPNKTFRYIYMAPYLGNDANDVPMQHTIYLVSSTPSSNENIILASDYFNDVPIQLRSENMPAIDNARFNPNPTVRLSGTPVVLTFNIPDVPDKTLPYRIRIHTDYLEYVSQSTGLNCVWDQMMEVYYYTTNTPGPQSITFKTTKDESSEYVRIDGDRFASSTIKRTVGAGEFKDVVYDISGGTVGSPATITFTFDNVGTIYANYGMYVYFTTQYLAPAPGSGIEATGNENEYRMWVSSAGVKTARFTLKQAFAVGEGETVTISSPSIFKTYSLDYQMPGQYVFGSKVFGYTNRPVFTRSNTVSPLSLSELNSFDTFDLLFNIPASTKINGQPISASNPLWVYFTMGDTRGTPNGNVGLNEFIHDKGKDFWFKITTTGDKVAKFKEFLSFPPYTVIMTSVSDNGMKVSSDLFETATGFENK